MKNHSEQVQGWEDLIFENRNKEYGAYVIRQKYSDSMLQGVMISMGAAMLLLLFSVTVNKKAIVTPVIKDPITVTFDSQPHIKPTLTPKTPQPPQKASTPNLPPKPVTHEVADIPFEQTPTSPGTEGAENTTGPVTTGSESSGTEITVAAPAENKVYIVVEKMPLYNGGQEAMMKFLSKKLKYPRRSEINKIEGTVYVQFVISADGSITQVELVKGVDKDCDKEAMRVIQLMPAWTPGFQNNMPVAVRMIVPIKFKLREQL